MLYNLLRSRHPCVHAFLQIKHVEGSNLSIEVILMCSLRGPLTDVCLTTGGPSSSCEMIIQEHLFLNIPIQTFIISQDDHLTAGAWAACSLTWQQTLVFGFYLVSPSLCISLSPPPPCGELLNCQLRITKLGRGGWGWGWLVISLAEYRHNPIWFMTAKPGEAPEDKYKKNRALQSGKNLFSYLSSANSFVFGYSKIFLSYMAVSNY